MKLKSNEKLEKDMEIKDKEIAELKEEIRNCKRYQVKTGADLVDVLATQKALEKIKDNLTLKLRGLEQKFSDFVTKQEKELKDKDLVIQGLKKELKNVGEEIKETAKWRKEAEASFESLNKVGGALKEDLSKLAFSVGNTAAKLTSPCNVTFRELGRTGTDFCVRLSTKVFTYDTFFTSQADVIIKVTEKSIPSFKSEIKLKVEKRGEQFLVSIKGRNDMKSDKGFPKINGFYTDGSVIYVSVSLSNDLEYSEVKVRINSVDDWEVKVVPTQLAYLQNCEQVVPFEEKQKTDSISINRTPNDPIEGFYDTVSKYIGKEVGSSAIIVKTGTGKIYWPHGLIKETDFVKADESSGHQTISFYMPDYWVASVLRTGEKDLSGTLWAGGEVYNLVNIVS